MLKKVLSLLMLMVLIVNVIGCGIGENSSDKSVVKSKSSSKLKGDFIFYVKDDGYTYFTNCENIEETLLYKGDDVQKIWIDSKRNNVIFVSGGLYYMPINDKNNQLVTIENDVSNIQIVDNKYIVYICNYNLFVYDLDTKTKEKISNEKYGEIYSNYKICDGSEVVWLPGSHSGEGFVYQKVNKLNAFCSYNLKSKTKRIVEIDDEERHFKFGYIGENGVWDKYCYFNGDTLYYVDYIIDNPADPNYVNSILYEVKLDGSKKIIDELQGTTKSYTDDAGQNRNTVLTIDIISAGERGVFYKKGIEWTGNTYDDGRPIINSKYYGYIDGKLMEIDTSFDESSDGSISSSIINYADNKYDSYGDYMSYLRDINFIEPIAKTDRDSFFIGHKEIKGIKGSNRIVPSSDSERFAVFKDGGECSLISKNAEEEIKLGEDVKDILYFDNDNILYIDGEDVMLNQQPIFYNFDSYSYSNYRETGVQHYIVFNKDLSCILLAGSYEHKQFYKKRTVYDLPTEMKAAPILTNNGNVSYRTEDGIYLFKDGEISLVLSGLTQQEYWNSLLRYTVME